MTTVASHSPPARTSIRGVSMVGLAPMAAAIAAMAVVLFAPQVLNDGDTYWHLAAGQWIWAHGAVPHQDVFSFTHLGQPWVAQEWLSEALMALAFRAGGWTGLVALAAGAAGLTAGLLASRLGRCLSGLTLAVVLALTAACMAPSLLVRPHLLALPLVILWTGELLDARAAGRAPRLALAGLMLVWANLHGSYLLGFVLMGPFALEALVGAPAGGRLKAVRGWGLVGAACAAASLATPHGLAGLTYPFQILSMTTLDAITEWRAADFSRLGPFELALLATLFVGFSRGMRVPPLRLVLLLALLHMALQHERQLIILAIVAPLLLAAPLAGALGQNPEPTVSRWSWAGFILVAAALLGARFASPIVRRDDPVTPMSALAHVPAEIRGLPMLNTYGLGGYLIFKGVKPFIDGRSDMYGDAHFRRDLRIMAGDGAALDRAVAQYRIVWALLAPDEPLARALDARGDWRRVYVDPYAIAFVRVAPQP